METLFKHPHTMVKKSDVHGWGVFATQDIPEGTLLETCHYVKACKFTSKLYAKMTGLHNYTFFDTTGEYACTVFGWGSIFNSSEDANAAWQAGEDLFSFWTTKDIKAGEEIFLDYSIEFHK